MARFKTTGIARHSLLVDHAQLEANARVSTVKIINSSFVQYRMSKDELGMSGRTLVIHLIIGLSSVQELVRQYPIPSDLRSFEPAPMHLSGSASRRAIAAASGLLRGTMRRIVDGLIAEGRIISVGRSGVCAPLGTLCRAGHFLAELMSATTRNATMLFRHGVLIPKGQGELNEKLGASAARATDAALF